MPMKKDDEEKESAPPCKRMNIENENDIFIL